MERLIRPSLETVENTPECRFSTTRTGERVKPRDASSPCGGLLTPAPGWRGVILVIFVVIVFID